MTKKHIIETKILPYFENKSLAEIDSTDVIQWQNVLLCARDENGKAYVATYLRTVQNQLSAIFNHAHRFYGLPENPSSKAGKMGKAKAKEMLFWTKEEYEKFSDAIKDKPISYYAFQVLYWTGIREGELISLVKSDFDLVKRKLTISKSYQRINGEDMVTSPKTEKSNGVIDLPKFLCKEMEDYFGMFYSLADDTRLFHISKSYLHHEMDRGCKKAGVKRVRVHDIRHSHVAHLISLGFTPVEIAERLGHEGISVTYTYSHLYPSKQKELADRLDADHGSGDMLDGLAEGKEAGLAPKPKSKKWKRSVIMNFRVSPEEKQLIDDRIALSGLGKADFFIRSCMHQKISTFGNIRTFEEIKRKMLLIDRHLQEVERTEELDVEILVSLRMILEMLDGLEDGKRQP